MKTLNLENSKLNISEDLPVYSVALWNLHIMWKLTYILLCFKINKRLLSNLLWLRLTLYSLLMLRTQHSSSAWPENLLTGLEAHELKVHYLEINLKITSV